MPKMRSCLSERASRSSSKTSKEKTNMVLLASQCPADTDQSSQGELLCSSEKDSGYSDNGSDWQQMDGDDQCSSVSEPQGMETLLGQERDKPLHQSSTMETQRSVKPLHQGRTMETQRSVKALHQGRTMQTQRSVKPLHQGRTMETQRSVKPLHQSSTMETQRSVKPLHQGRTMETQRSDKPLHQSSTMETQRSVKALHQGSTMETQRSVKPLHQSSTMETQRSVKALHQGSTMQTQRSVKPLHQSSTMETQRSVKALHQGRTMQTQRSVKALHQGRTMQTQRSVKALHQGSTIQGHRASELTPLYVLKNVVLKQPVPVQNGSDCLIQSHLTWSNTGGGGDSSGPTHVILLQPPSISIPSPSSTKHRKPQFRRTNKKTKGAFLPTRSSYTRIAPRPGKKRHDEPPAGLGKGTESEGQSLSKRINTDFKRDEVSTTTTDVQLPKHHPHKQSDSRTHRLQSRPITFPPSSPSTVSSSQGCPSVSSLEISRISSSSNSSSPPSATRGTHNGLSNAQHCRFRNTLEILSQSGLLDITLRTKDLLSQSNATERDIAKLRQHTQLLCQAVSRNHDSRGGVTLETLHETMEESGDYPTLKCLDKVEVFHTTQTLNGSNAPSTPTGSVQEPSQNHPLSHNGMLSGTSSLPPDQRNESKPSSTPSENFTFIPPDSSTHWGVF